MAHTTSQAARAVEAAEIYAAWGWAPLPLRGKVPVGPWIRNSAENWREHWVPGATNVGIRTGAASGPLVVDIDARHKGTEAWRQLMAVHGEPATVVVETGGGGLHYYFAWDERANVLKSASRVVRLPGGERVGIDIKGRGGQVVAPPSRHPETGRAYAFRPAGHIAELPPLPPWLFELLAAGQAARQKPERR